MHYYFLCPQIISISRINIMTVNPVIISNYIIFCTYAFTVKCQLPNFICSGNESENNNKYWDTSLGKLRGIVLCRSVARVGHDN